MINLGTIMKENCINIHTIYKPIVRFMGRLNFAQRFWFTCLILLFPSVVSLSYSIRSEGSLVFDNKKELAGLHTIEKLLHVATHIPEHRGLSYAYLLGAGNFEKNMSAKQAEIDFDLLKLAGEVGDDAGSMLKNEHVDRIQRRWRLILENIPKSQAVPHAIFDQHVEFMEDILGILFDVSVQSGLYLDPKLASHHIIDTLILDIPWLLEFIGQARGLGTGWLTRGSMSMEEREKLILLTSQIQTKLDRLGKCIKVCYDYAPEHRALNEPLAVKAFGLTKKFIVSTKNDLLGPAAMTMPPDRYFDLGTSAIEANLALLRADIAVVRKMIESRAAGLYWSLARKVMTLIAGVAVCFYLFMGVSISSMNSIRGLQKGAARFGAGQLDKPIKMENNDELSPVAGSFNAMAQELSTIFGELEEKEIKLVDAHEKMTWKNQELEAEIVRRQGIEVEMSESEKNFRSLVENSPTGISIVQNQQVVFGNPAQTRIFKGMSADDFSDFHWVHPEDRETVRQCYLDMSKGIKNFNSGEFRIIEKHTPNNSHPTERWIHCCVTGIVYLGEKALLFNMTDITQQKECEQLVMLHDKMSSLGRVTAGIAHEIRNPLSSIRVHLKSIERILQYDPQTLVLHLDRMQEALGEMDGATQKINQMIKRVMDFSRPARRRLQMTNVNHCVRRAVQLASPALRKSGVELSFDPAEDVPDCLVDPHRIEQVLMNLITNAVEAMRDMPDEKRIAVTTEVETTEAGGSLRVCIADSGPGLSGHEKIRIFEPFHTTKTYGTGIGLSICDRIVSDHNGAIDMEESPWGGAAFIVRLPCVLEVKT